MAWEAIIEECRGTFSEEAIAETVRLAREALVIHASELVPEMASPQTIWMRKSRTASGNYWGVGGSPFIKSDMSSVVRA